MKVNHKLMRTLMICATIMVSIGIKSNALCPDGTDEFRYWWGTYCQSVPGAVTVYFDMINKDGHSVDLVKYGGGWRLHTGKYWTTAGHWRSGNTQAGLNPGPHYLVFRPVTGFLTPPSRTINIEPRKTLNIYERYYPDPNPTPTPAPKAY